MMSVTLPLLKKVIKEALKRLSLEFGEFKQLQMLQDSSHSLRNFAKKNSPTLCKQTSSHEEFGVMATAPSGVATVVS